MKIFKALLIVLALGLVPASALAQDHAAPAPAADQHAQPATPAAAGDHAAADASHAAGAEGAEEEHAEAPGMMETVAKLVNFAILVFILVHFLRRPIANYLVDRRQQIRHALVEAAATRAQASTDLGKIESRLAALPAELEALKARGADEVQAEQARIRALAVTERERVLAQTRREIEQQYRLSRRALVQETAEQAAKIARARIESDMTPADQTRLIDRYLNQVRA